MFLLATTAHTFACSHCGQPHNGIEACGSNAKWSAAAIFEVKDGKLHSFTKKWDKSNMWKQLGWVCSLFTASVCGSGPRSELHDTFWEYRPGARLLWVPQFPVSLLGASS